MRIVSFLPSATEMLYALGLDEQLVGVTHECDYPPQARNKPVVVRNVLPVETMTQAEIDRAVAERMHNGDSLYQIDEALLRKLSPDLILTQNLCQVCAPSGNEVSQVLQTLEKRPEILWLTPRTTRRRAKRCGGSGPCRRAASPAPTRGRGARSIIPAPPRG